MPILILWIIWKIAEPHTTKMKRANSQGPTDAFSSGAFLEVLATLPRWVMFLLCFSLAMRIRCLATIFAGSHLPDARGPDSTTDSPTDLLGAAAWAAGARGRSRARKRKETQRNARQCNATQRNATPVADRAARRLQLLRGSAANVSTERGPPRAEACTPPAQARARPRPLRRYACAAGRGGRPPEAREPRDARPRKQSPSQDTPKGDV